MAAARILFVGLCFEERAGNARAAPIANLALATSRAALPAIRPGAAGDADPHGRVVLVVLDHLVEELGLELAGDHAVDHRLSVGLYFRDVRSLVRRVHPP